MKAIWKGNISFGLINIPVNLYSASKARSFSFKFLRKSDLCPVRNKRVCQNTGEDVDYKEVVRGYEINKGQFVVMNEEDFKRAEIERESAIEVVEFVPENQIETELIEKPYYLEPQKTAEKAYGLFREALKKTKKVAVANFIMKTREHLAIIKPKGDILMLDQLRYLEEIRQPEDLNIGRAEIKDKELAMAVRLIDEMSEKFDLEKFHDKRSEELHKIIEQKAKGQLPHIDLKRQPTPSAPVDIMEQLKQSLEMARQSKDR